MEETELIEDPIESLLIESLSHFFVHQSLNTDNLLSPFLVEEEIDHEEEKDGSKQDSCEVDWLFPVATQEQEHCNDGNGQCR